MATAHLAKFASAGFTLLRLLAFHWYQICPNSTRCTRKPNFGGLAPRLLGHFPNPSTEINMYSSLVILSLSGLRLTPYPTSVQLLLHTNLFMNSFLGTGLHLKFILTRGAHSSPHYFKMFVKYWKLTKPVLPATTPNLMDSLSGLTKHWLI